jgi:hypothetical protein
MGKYLRPCVLCNPEPWLAYIPIPTLLLFDFPLLVQSDKASGWQTFGLAQWLKLFLQEVFTKSDTKVRCLSQEK